MAQIWKLWWTIAAAGLLPLAIAAHVVTRNPTSKPAQARHCARADLAAPTKGAAQATRGVQFWRAML
jgi:hypothetical protein